MDVKRTFLISLLLWMALSACGLFSSAGGFFPRPAATLAPTAVPSRPTVTAQPTVTALPLPTRVEKGQPTATPGPSPTPKTNLLDEYLPGNEKVAETDHFVIYAKDGYFPIEKDWWLKEIEVAYDYVSRRLGGAEVEEKILLGFLPPDRQACPVRGLASHDHPPVVLVYASPESTRAYLLGVLAHEVGHAIPSEGFPEGMPDDLALTEGLATWASEKYWTDWMATQSLDAMVREYRREGEYEPLHENYDLHGIYPWQNGGEDCLARRDKMYTEWASFLGYLIHTYGWEKAHRLFKLPEPQHKDGQVIHFPPDYVGIYGKSLNQLEAEWLRVLDRYLTTRYHSYP